jgi:2-polyprenyl-3-methyl-5-hydroxy-6-metoxy-1,4-benzoquinol methylase
MPISWMGSLFQGVSLEAHSLYILFPCDLYCWTIKKHQRKWHFRLNLIKYKQGAQLNEKPDNKASNRVCPWWLCFTFDNPLRRIVQNPERILKPYIKPGWKALDVGPGMGYFTIPLAKLVGNTGQVIAADLQKRMLDAIARRAAKEGVQNRLILHLCSPDKIGVSEPIDFVLAFWMVHEVPDQARFLNEIAAALKPQSLFLLVEPRLHVSKTDFNATLEIAQKAGLSAVEKPRIFISYAVLLKKG